MMHFLHHAARKQHWRDAAPPLTVRAAGSHRRPRGKPPMSSSATRIEHDFLGEKEIPADAYWGVHSARAVENFPISGQTVAQVPELVRALAYVKKAAARANAELGVIDAPRANAIQQACDDLIHGRLHEQFVVD